MEVLQSNITAIADVIDMAIAPVFLLTGIAGLLAVLTDRLNRIIDRSRVLAIEIEIENIICRAKLSLQVNEIKNLFQRCLLIHIAITLACSGALLLCSVIMIIFTGIFLNFGSANFIAILFIICMVLVIMSISFFLLEVFFSTRVDHSGLEGERGGSI